MIRRAIANPEVATIARHLKPRGPYALMPTGWYVDDDAPLADPYERCNVYKTRRGFKGTTQRLGRGSLVSCMEGYSFPLPGTATPDKENGLRIAQLYLQKSHEELYYVPEQKTLASVAAEGIHCYINGYSDAKSAELKERIDQNLASWETSPEGRASFEKLLLDSWPPQR